MANMVDDGTEFEPNDDVVIDPKALLEAKGYRYDDEDDANIEDETEQEEKEIESKEETPTKKYNNPEARAHYLEREKKRNYRKLEQELVELKELVKTLVKKEEPKEDEPELTFEEDPLGYQTKKIEKIEKKLTEKEQQEKEKEQYQFQQDQFVYAVKTADTIISEYAKTNEHYSEAMDFLALAYKEDLLREDDYDDEELIARLQYKIIEEKLQALEKGLNPGDYFYRMARYYGYEPQMTEKKETAKATPNPKIEIQRKRQDQRETRSIASAPGAGVSKGKLRVSKLDRTSFNEEIDKMLSSGEKTGGHFRKTPDVRKLLAHKIVEA